MLFNFYNMKIHNFSAGPCILPQQVLLQASESIMDFNGSGLSLIEISHRSKAFVDVIEEAKDIALDLLDLNNKGYKVLFLQGGASTQFLMTAYNLLENKASFLNTGSWSDKAIKEAKLFGAVNELASSKDSNFNYIPKDYSIPSDSDYFHCTSNNTIFGTQIKDFKESSIPVICDMSSDIFSRVLDFSKFDLSLDLDKVFFSCSNFSLSLISCRFKLSNFSKLATSKSTFLSLNFFLKVSRFFLKSLILCIF